MTTRGVIGDIRFLDASAAAGDPVGYRLERVGFAEDAIYMPSDIDTVVLPDGTVERRELWASAEGGRNLLCILPNGYTWRFRLEPGDTDITLQELHALNAPLEPEVSPTIQTLVNGAVMVNTAAERARYASTTSGLGADLIGTATGRTAADKLRDVVSILDYIAPADHTAVIAGTSLNDHAADITNGVIEAAAAGRALEIIGKPNLASQVLLANLTDLQMVGRAGAELVIPTESISRPFVIRDCDGVRLDQLRLRSYRTEGSTNGICFENSSGLRAYGGGVYGFSGYGMVISEATDPAVSGTDMSFDANTRTIHKPSGGMDAVPVGSTIRIGRSLLNNVVRIKTGGTDTTLIVDGALIDEDAAGLSVALYLATECNDNEIAGWSFLDCGIGGLNEFAKVRSDGLRVHHSFFRRCNVLNGVPVSGAAALKGGQFTQNSSLHHNDIALGGTGISIGTYENLFVGYNIIRDTMRFPIAISVTPHRLFTGSSSQPSLASLTIVAPEIWMTPEFAATASAAYPAININGPARNPGPIRIIDPIITGWKSNPWGVNKSLVRMPNISITGLKATGCGGFGSVAVLEATANTSVGSYDLTNVNNGVGGPPVGWYVGTGVREDVGGVLQTDTTILEITPVPGSVTVSDPAILSGTYAFRSVDFDVEFTGTATVGSPVITGVLNTQGVEEELVLVSEALPVNAQVIAVAPGVATFTLDKPALASQTIPITSEYPVGLTLENNTYTNPVVRTIATTHTSTTIDGIPTVEWTDLRVGMNVVGSGIPLNATIDSLPSIGTAILTLPTTASASGVALTFAFLMRANIRAHGGKITNDRYIGGGDYALVLHGSWKVRRTYFEDFNPIGTGNRGCFFLSDNGTYTVVGCEADGTLSYLINNTATTHLTEHGNIVPVGTRPTLVTTGFGSYSTAVATTANGRRIFFAPAPPLAADGTFDEGDIVLNTGAGVFGWKNNLAGSPGTWESVVIHGMTTDTAQAVTGAKTFSAAITAVTGALGIGTSVPETALHLLVSGTAGVPATNSGYSLLFQRSGASGSTAGMAILSGNAATGVITFGDTDAFVRGQLVYNHATDTMTLVTAAGTRLTIDSSGRAGFAVTPTARVHVPPGLASANNAALKMSPGVLLTTPEDGAWEYAGGHLYFTIGSTRNMII